MPSETKTNKMSQPVQSSLSIPASIQIEQEGQIYGIAGLALFRGEYNAEFGGLMAASTVMMLPVVILFFLTQRTFIQGITLTGIKG